MQVANSTFQLDLRIEENSKFLRLYEKNTLIDSTEPGFFLPMKRESHPGRYLFLNGFGLGSLLQDSLQMPLPETEEYIVVEPSIPRFLFALAQTKFNDFFLYPKVHWMIGLTGSEIDREFFILLSNRQKLSEAKAYQIRNHPALNSLHSGYFEEVQARWKNALEISKNAHGFLSDSLEGLKNTLGNLDWLRATPGIELLKNQFTDVPALIISTGPSLQKSLSELRELQNKAVLLAADASLKILIENGIHPHFVFCLERDEGSKPFFLDIPPEKARAHLVVFPLVPSTVIQAYKGPHFAAYRQYGYCRFFEDQAPKGSLQCGPSVAHMALEFAQYLGCNKAILVGQDLAYDPESLASHPPGISYAEWAHSNTEEELRKKLRNLGDDLIWVPGNIHEKVPTSGFYEVFRVNFGEMKERLKLEIINSTEGGARIPAIEWKKLSESTKDFPERNSLFEKIAELRKTYTPASKIQTELFLETIRLAQSKLDEFRNIPTPKSYAEVEALRDRQETLQNDPVFMALTGIFSGRKLIELEWEWNLLFDEDEFRLQKMKVITSWYEEMRQVLTALRSLLQTPQNEARD
jgi:hypothetical protein